MHRYICKLKFLALKKIGVLGRGQSPHFPCGINLVIFFSEKIAIFVTLKNIKRLDFQRNLKRKYHKCEVRKALVFQRFSSPIILSESFLYISVYVPFFSYVKHINEW